MEKSFGAAVIDAALNRHGCTIEELSDRIGYAVRTLRGVRSGEVPLSPKLERQLTKLETRPAPVLQERGVDYHAPGATQTLIKMLTSRIAPDDLIAMAADIAKNESMPAGERIEILKVMLERLAEAKS